eukprot:CAMPEP_0181343808 /NCGR_PEP_ID=MMETSP1101-20121128/31806_1 /TAXON_ID=46948 /ORGANISM="Rhodomonas abbreviata, Strain Caron Lab Isolate" /LENGTH=595 /DNA_ID=CAMNT_0023455507 /DNA_START=13 /DNA_END=1799 /DNA_ORIENTATION=+
MVVVSGGNRASSRLILPIIGSLALFVLITLYSSGTQRTALLSTDGKDAAKQDQHQRKAQKIATSGSGQKAYHGMQTGKSRDALDEYFEAIPVFHVNAYHEMGKGSRHTVAQTTAKAAQKELDSYFDQMPTDDVDAYHEAKAVWHGKKYEDKQSRKDLNQYFNRKGLHLPSGLHKTTSADAVQDLLSYYDSIPTSKVNAFHESQMLVPTSQTTKGEGAKTAFKDISSYFDSIPTHSVNAFHEKAAHDHVAPRDAEYGSKKAFSDLSDYFSSIPTHAVNAYHESASKLALEGVEKPVKFTGREHASADRAARVQRAVHNALVTAESTTEQEAAGNEGAQEKGEARGEAQHEQKQVRSEADGDSKEQGEATGKEPESKATSDEQETVRRIRPVVKPRADFANLNDEQGPDADAPTATEEERHADGYDTQYGLKSHLAADVTIEKTPSGPVLSSLTTHMREAKREAAKRAAIAEKEAAEEAAEDEAVQGTGGRSGGEAPGEVGSDCAGKVRKAGGKGEGGGGEQQQGDTSDEEARGEQAAEAGAGGRGEGADAATVAAGGEQQLRLVGKAGGKQTMSGSLGAVAAHGLCSMLGVGCSWA